MNREEPDKVLNDMLRVMVYAQLDLGAAINFAVGVHDTFSVEAAQATIKELHAFTDDDAGMEAANIADY